MIGDDESMLNNEQEKLTSKPGTTAKTKQACGAEAPSVKDLSGLESEEEITDLMYYFSLQKR